MALRTFRERLFQTFAFEAGGILLASPLYGLVFGAAISDGAILMLAMSVAALLWSPMHNTLFDLMEWHFLRRVASDRTQGLRLVHAISHEVTVMVCTVPILIWLGGHSLPGAVLVDLGLTTLFVAYAFVFHVIYDRIFPVGRLAPVVPKGFDVSSHFHEGFIR